ncbi:hypothetical protein FACS1894211_06420 [Clostridia bacterium]|nr:hypothetical protein FACS1894211_06420 [Clostridia bacterium]
MQHSSRQRYVAAEVDVATFSANSVLEYCNIPRSKAEMLAHFGVYFAQLNKLLMPLLSERKLIEVKSRETVGKGWQRYLAATTDAATINEQVLAFCRTPKYLHEIGGHFGISRKCDGIKQFISPLVESGQLKSYYNADTCGTHLKYYTVDKDNTVLTNEALLEYCAVPRGKKEICEHFGAKIWTVKRMLNQLADNGKLKYLIPAEPTSKNQKYMVSECAAPILTDNAVLALCETPKTKAEVAEYFGLPKTHIHYVLGRLIKEGRLSYTHTDKLAYRFQGYAAVR